MATFRDKVVTVTLNYGATAINETQFDIPLILVGHNVTSDVTNTYTSTDAMVSAGFSVNSAAYKMAKLLFDGLYAPERVIVGKRDITATDFTVGELENGGVGISSSSIRVLKVKIALALSWVLSPSKIVFA